MLPSLVAAKVVQGFKTVNVHGAPPAVSEVLAPLRSFALPAVTVTMQTAATAHCTHAASSMNARLGHSCPVKCVTPGRVNA